MAGIAGRYGQIKVIGSGVAFTAEATTSLGDNKTYQLTNAAKRLWAQYVTGEPNLITVLVAGVAVASSAYTLNRLSGKVIFNTADAGRGTVTVTGAYYPLASAARINAYTYEIESAMVDDTDFDSSYADGGFPRNERSALDLSGTVSGFIDVDGRFRTDMLEDKTVILEVYANRAGSRLFIAGVVFSKVGLAAAMDSNHTQTVEFKGYADEDGTVFAL